ncbi:YcjF family protein [Clostridium tagluense]|uniref:YcjF family protein n=1 Tax=Clostridium tagluense TaxID=360422 RepID=UPI001CF45F71|nr:GTPase [Clostridium tagluense]MCB2300300.1 GTP-binding DUF697 domain-containing protein [Clostridium tagluense]
MLLCGATGVGKSSVINKIFGRDVARVGSGQPVTRGITKYQDENLDVNLYDSEGYEVGNAAQSHFRKDIIGFIDDRKNESQDLGAQIHLVWYCISAGNKRITELDFKVIKEIQLRKIKVAVLFTQIDSVDEEELNTLIITLREEMKKIDSFNLSTYEGVPEKYLDWEKLMNWSVENLDESLREGFLNSTIIGLEQKKKYIRKVIIPRYAASAAGIALSPVPLSDSVLLMPLQTTMALHIFDIWGISKNKQALKTLLSTTIISQLGKSVAKLLMGNIFKLIPGVGDLVGGAINATVATSITYTLGYSISEICNKYSEGILKGQNIDILDFFTSSNLEEMLKLRCNLWNDIKTKLPLNFEEYMKKELLNWKLDSEMIIDKEVKFLKGTSIAQKVIDKINYRLESKFYSIDKKIEKIINETIHYYITLINVNNSLFAESLYFSNTKMKSAEFKSKCVDFKCDSSFKFGYYAAIAVSALIPIYNLFVPFIAKEKVKDDLRKALYKRYAEVESEIPKLVDRFRNAVEGNLNQLLLLE